MDGGALVAGHGLPRFTNFLFNNDTAPARRAENAARPTGASENNASRNALLTNGASAPGGGVDIFELQAQFQRISASLQIEQAAERIAGENSNGESAEGVAEQLAFKFFFEAQSEQLAVFRRRTDEVADGQEGSRRDLFIATRERISIEFRVSAQVSSAALNGFANAAESNREDGNRLDQLVQTARDLLEQSNELFNEVFHLLDGFFNSGGELSERFDTLLQGLEELGLVNLNPLNGNGNNGQGNGRQATVQQQTFSFNVQLEFNFTSETVTVEQSDPITLDLDGDGIDLTSFQNGARFDITGQGRVVNTAFVTGGDAFLATDRNGNGVIDDGAELFGDQRGAANGFEELRRFDTNGDGLIDRNDLNFNELLLFQDNGNGVTEEGELRNLAEEGIESLSLDYRNVDLEAGGGNRLAQTAYFNRRDGSAGLLADAILNFTA